MWIVLVGDMDIDYASAYGPFDTVGEANAVANLYPDDDSGENNVRVVALGSVDNLRKRMESMGRG